MKGIVLAGGTGSRLWPITKTVCKQLLPVYDKPMIYYPLSTLMLAGVREILIITSPKDSDAFQSLLSDGSQLGISITYSVQPKPEGIAQALIIGEKFLNSDSCLLILGDNIFHGAGLGHELARSLPKAGAHIFTYEVSNPEEYGVLRIDKDSKPISITEKPKVFISNLAVTGLYYFDKNASIEAKKLSPSDRGELEITSLIERYLQADNLTFTALSRGTAWLDTGNPNSLNEASNYIRIIEERTGLKIGCIEEISFRNSWIDRKQLLHLADLLGLNSYAKYLISLASEI